MKKCLFTMAALVASSMSFAQNVEMQPKMMEFNSNRFKVEKQEKAVAGEMKAKKTAATGNYYTRPEGSMYVGATKTNSGFSATILCLQPSADAVFTNKNTDPSSAKWSMVTSSSSIDLSDYADANNNLVWSVSPLAPNTTYGLSSYYAPTLTKGSDAYILPNNSNEDGSALAAQDLGPLTFQGSNVGTKLLGYSGLNSTGYLFGTGSCKETDETTGTSTVYKFYGVRQHFEKPMSPLYVEDVYVTCCSGHGHTQPLSNGAKLTMYIVDEDDNSMATLTADESDATAWMSGTTHYTTSNEYMGGTLYFYNLTFSQKVKDEDSGDMVASPFVIDKPFYVTITGFDSEDVDIALCGYSPADEDPIDGASILMYPEGGSAEDTKTIGYKGNLSTPITFTGLLDNVQVASTLQNSDGSQVWEKCNVIRIGTDGTTNTFDSYPDLEGVAAFIYTATPWKDANDNDNYYYEVVKTSDGTNGDDWILGMTVDTSAYTATSGSTTYATGLNYATFQLSSLSEGGRWAVLDIKGRGITSETPVILLQGTATLDDALAGIDNVTVDKNGAVKANANIYNLNGQRVSKNSTGILIQNGKKYIKK